MGGHGAAQHLGQLLLAFHVRLPAQGAEPRGAPVHLAQHPRLRLAARSPAAHTRERPHAEHPYITSKARTSHPVSDPQHISHAMHTVSVLV